MERGKKRVMGFVIQRLHEESDLMWWWENTDREKESVKLRRRTDEG